jgi:hypothetical protein
MSDTPIWSFRIVSQVIEAKEITPFSLSVPTYICSATAMTITLPLGSPIPAAFKVIGQWTTAHQQFNTSLPATNCSSVFSQRCSFFFFSPYPCKCHAWCSICWYFIQEVIFCCYWSWLSHQFLIIFYTDECTTSWHMDIDFNSKVKIDFFPSVDLHGYIGCYVTQFSRYMAKRHHLTWSDSCLLEIVYISIIYMNL